MEKGRTFISCYASSDLALKVRVEAAKKNISRSELVRRAVVAYLQQNTQNREEMRNEQATA